MSFFLGLKNSQAKAATRSGPLLPPDQAGRLIADADLGLLDPKALVGLTIKTIDPQKNRCIVAAFETQQTHTDPGGASYSLATPLYASLSDLEARGGYETVISQMCHAHDTKYVKEGALPSKSRTPPATTVMAATAATGTASQTTLIDKTAAFWKSMNNVSV